MCSLGRMFIIAIRFYTLLIPSINMLIVLVCEKKKHIFVEPYWSNLYDSSNVDIIIYKRKKAYIIIIIIICVYSIKKLNSTKVRGTWCLNLKHYIPTYLIRGENNSCSITYNKGLESIIRLPISIYYCIYSDLIVLDPMDCSLVKILSP